MTSETDHTARLDPELSRAAQLQPYVAFGDPLASRRNFARSVKISRALRGPSPVQERVATEDRTFTVPGEGHELTVRLYRPEGLQTPAPVLVYFHGGAFVAGDLDTEHDRCLALALAADCLVVSVDYRRPPEHPFPVPGEDCLAAVRWVAAEAAELGADAARIAVGGSSAGGTLAAAVALMCRDRGGPDLVLQMLLYPALDDRLDSGSMRRYPRTSAWHTEDSLYMWQHYLGADPAHRESPYAVPARCTDLSGLAPAYLLVAEVDALRDEAVALAARMLEAGVSVELHLYAGTFHGFEAAVPLAQASQRALAEQGAALRRAFARG
ncbi:alpha/beta hydrolase [Streptacidiphilus griseoplanus]|uniref:alpha/beta hydrolase n=1 Tax=Peterkaempfera griseoplana TaxID=66896 RepID=UPI0007C87ACA|nr:alpha/beta hydrolase [Peterkaempfera griseoplana]BCN13449.1 alpha/beta hydrolase AzpM [Peterkaempfera griseoplana]